MDEEEVSPSDPRGSSPTKDTQDDDAVMIDFDDACLHGGSEGWPKNYPSRTL